MDLAALAQQILGNPQAMGNLSAQLMQQGAPAATPQSLNLQGLQALFQQTQQPGATPPAAPNPAAQYFAQGNAQPPMPQVPRMPMGGGGQRPPMQMGPPGTGGPQMAGPGMGGPQMGGPQMGAPGGINPAMMQQLMQQRLAQLGGTGGKPLGLLMGA